MKIIISFFTLILLLTNISCDNSISPDDSFVNSTNLIYISNESGNYEVYSKDLVSNKIIRLTNSFETKNKPHFFPDGEKILYSTSYSDGGKIYSINFDGSNNRLLEDSCDYSPSEDISPDGNFIVYQKEFIIPNSNYSLTCIALMNSDGSNKKIISPKPGAQPRFSNGGNLICYTTYGGTEPSKIILYNIQTQLTDSISIPGLGSYESILNPQFSPDGDKILFNTNIDAGFAFYTIGLDGENLTRLSPYNFFTEDFRYSPDGKYIVFAKWDGEVQHIYKFNNDGSNLKMLSDNNSFELNPECSRDASKIVISSDLNNNQKYNIVIMNADGQNRQVLIDSQSKVFLPVLW
jgi:Tol biopolymer transport system component